MPITEADLETIEKKMIETFAQQGATHPHGSVEKPTALKNFTEKGDRLQSGADPRPGRRHDLVLHQRRIHRPLPGTAPAQHGVDQAIKLTSVAGAYWRGNEKNKMLHPHLRHLLPKKSMLDEYLAMMEEARNATTASWARSWSFSASRNA